jgi:hypothetical protein
MKNRINTLILNMQKIYLIVLLVFCLMPGVIFAQGSTPNLFYNNGAVVYVQHNAVLHVQGDVVNNSGTFTNNGLLNVEGDFTNSGIFTTDINVGEGTVRLIGNSTMAGTSGTQTLSGNLSSPGGSGGSFYNLVIDRGTAGQVVTLGNNITVTGSLVWNGYSTTANTYSPSTYSGTLGSSTIMTVRGSLPTGNGLIQPLASTTNQVYVNNNASTSVAGYTATAYVNGYMQRQVASSSSYDFPVGYYNPVGPVSNYELANITFGAGLATTTKLLANFTPGVTTQPNPSNCIINGSKINALLNGGFWTIAADAEPTAGTYTAVLNMTGFTNTPAPGVGTSGPITPAQQIGLVKRGNSSVGWVGCGDMVYNNSGTNQNTGACTDNATISGGVATVTRTVVPSFSDFGIGIEQSNNLPLPVELISLTAEPVDNSFIRVDWATASEQDNKGFDVMRSVDGVNFTNIGWVDGHGTTSVQNNYSYDDKNVQPNVTYYYRLNQVNVDGVGTLTYIVSAAITGAPGITVSELMPNPTSGQTRLVITTTIESQQASVRFYDILGRLVMSSDNNTIARGTNTLSFDMSSFADATYSVAIRIGDNVYSRKVVLVK